MAYGDIFKVYRVICNDTRPCFARHLGSDGEFKCTILRDTYMRDGECKFAKEKIGDIDYFTMQRRARRAELKPGARAPMQAAGVKT